MDVKHQENPYLLLLLYVLKTIRSPEDGHTKSRGSQTCNVRLLKSTLIKLASFEMSHFQVAFYLFFRTSSGAQPYTYGNEFDLQDKWTCIKNSFHWEVVHHQDSLFETEVTGTWKWLMVKLNFKFKVHSWSLCHFAIIEICWSQHLE